MEELLILLLQVFGEVLFQILGSGLLDLLTWSWEREDSPRSRGCAIALVLFIVGGLLGWLSLLLVPHSLLPWGWLRMANLVIGPVASGWMSYRIAQWRQRRGYETSPGTHALMAGMACLGMVLVRLVGVVR
jgi:hypothetical protein